MGVKQGQLRTADDIAEAGLIPPERVNTINRVAARYAVAITPAMVELIDARDPEDPIARQFVPDEAELEVSEREEKDPIGDDRHSPVKGVVHRYEDRVLLKLSQVCAVYCRFCFRRETVGPGEDQILNGNDLECALGYIEGHPEIWEVIVTGGDPFVLSPRRLRDVVIRLGKIEHVKILRWHTRVPIVDPKRITDELVDAIISTRQTTYIAVHVNHARELSLQARRACAKLADAGIPLLAQTVLLKDINDDVHTLEALMRALVEARIKPYYLHHADLAPGTAKFRTTIEKGRGLMRALRARASGLCQSTFVLDIPGGFAKAALGPSDVRRAPGGYQLRDGQDCWHFYTED